MVHRDVFWMNSGDVVNGAAAPDLSPVAGRPGFPPGEA
jgi:hypothetical protein